MLHRWGSSSPSLGSLTADWPGWSSCLGARILPAPVCGQHKSPQEATEDQNGSLGDQSLPFSPRPWGGGLQWRKPEASDTFQSPPGQRLRLQRSLSPGAAPAASVRVPTLWPLESLRISLPCVHDVSRTRTLGVEGGEGLRTLCSLKLDGCGEWGWGRADPIRRG